jgi:hypothetical protein
MDDLFNKNDLLPLLVNSVVFVTWGAVLLWRLPKVIVLNKTQRVVLYILWTLSCFAMMAAPAGLLATFAIPIAWIHLLS